MGPLSYWQIFSEENSGEKKKADQGEVTSNGKGGVKFLSLF